jgi:hypothetical protein
MEFNRTIRVFVSSTFRDMEAERNELVKFVFPQLRRLCEERDVSWSEIDLRWGITDEEKAEGQVLPICLQEIENCRPFFIGILGERYGWVPDEIPKELVEQFGFLSNHPDSSVTELEIWHGVLEHPEMSNHSFFYFRSPEYIQTLPQTEQAIHLESPTAEEIQKLGLSKANQRVRERKHKLAALKERIRMSGFPLRDGFISPKDLGKQVTVDFINMIDQLFPVKEIPDPLTKERFTQNAYIDSFARVFIPHGDLFQRLNKHIEASTPPLIITGMSGSGKSALLANWVRQYTFQHPEDVLVSHFIGNSMNGADLHNTLRAVMVDIKERLNLVGKIPEDPITLPIVFRSYLAALQGKGRVILVLDAVDMLENLGEALDLLWLPTEIPTNLRVILSSSPGHMLDLLRERNWQFLEIQPFDINEKKAFLVNYLAQYGKKLASEQIIKIVSVKQTDLPMFLRSLLEEIRLYGDHFTLQKKIDEYLSAVNTTKLFDLILARYEHDFQTERPQLVRDTVLLLWGSRQGLTESELLDLLGTEDHPLPRAIFSPLFLAMEHYLGNQQGRITLLPGSLRKAVQDRYLSNFSVGREIHVQLATYFSSQEIGVRSIRESPWHWMMAEKWEQLSSQLMDLEFLTKAWTVSPIDVLTYWHKIESNSKIRSQDTYHFSLMSLDGNKDYLPVITELFIGLDHLRAAMEMTRRQIEYFRLKPNQATYLKMLIVHAKLLVEGGDLENAQKLYTEATIKSLLSSISEYDPKLNKASYEVIKSAFLNAANQRMAISPANVDSQLEMFDVYLKSLHGRAIIEYNNANPSAATNLLTEGLTIISDELNRFSNLSASIKNFFAHHYMIFLAQYTTFAFISGDEQDLMQMIIQSEELSRLFGDLPILATLLNNKGMLFDRAGNYTEALKQLIESETILEKGGLINQLRANLRNQSLILEKMSQNDLSAQKLEQSKNLAVRTARERFDISGELNKKSRALRTFCQLISLMLAFLSLLALFTEVGHPLFSFLDGAAGKFIMCFLLLLTGTSLEATAKWRARLDAAKQLKADSSAPSSLMEVQYRKQVIFDYLARMMFSAWIFYIEMLILLVLGVLSLTGVIPPSDFFTTQFGKISLLLILYFPILTSSKLFATRRRTSHNR